MSDIRILGADGKPISQRSVPLFVVALNRETGNTEITTSRELIRRLPLEVRQAVVNGIKKIAQEDFGVLMD